MGAVPKVTVRTLVRRAIGGSRLCGDRMRAQALHLRFAGIVVHPHARLGRGAQVDIAEGARLVIGPGVIGRDVCIQVARGASVVLNGSVVGRGSVIVARESILIQPGAMIAEMCVIRDSDHVRTDAGAIDERVHTSAPVVISEHAWLAATVIVLKGVTVGRSATVGAGAVVTRSVPACATVVGVPARETRSPRHTEQTHVDR